LSLFFLFPHPLLRSGSFDNHKRRRGEEGGRGRWKQSTFARKERTPRV